MWLWELLTRPNHSPLCDSVHTSRVWECVGSSLSLCICIFSHTENGKQVMCEPVWGGRLELPLYLPSCLFTVHKKHCICLDLIPLAHISLLQHGGQGGSQSGQRPRYATAELTGILPGAGCKIPFVWWAVRWGSSCGGLSKEGVFGLRGSHLRDWWARQRNFIQSLSL